MRTCLLIILGIVLNAQSLFAQSDQVSLLLQSPNGKNVKLVWFIKSIGSDVIGFDIKRKEGLQDWVKLNTEPIVPGISMKRNFQTLGVNKSEESLLKARLFKMLTNHKLKETDAQYLQKLSADEKALQELSNTIATDHEVALMHGFAYIDHTIPNKTDYQYGLFVQGTNRLLAKVSWNYGEVPDLNTVLETTSKSTIGSSGVQVMWSADLNKMKAGHVAGFNIYRQGIRLNTHPITAANVKEPSEFTWFDKSANSAIPIQYSISAESIFGIEGIIRSYTYDPADHPTEYKKAEVTEVSSLGYYFKDGISVKWNFPKEYERFIKGFYVEKENVPNGYVRVSPLMEPTTRVFIDKTPSPTGAYIKFRLVAVYNDRTMDGGTERLYSYFPITEPPIPDNLNARLEATNKKGVISLTWDRKLAGDSITDHYKVYVNEQAEDKYAAADGDRPVASNKYLYRVRSLLSRQYKFYVTAVNRTGGESAPSDTVTIQSQSAELPMPENVKVTTDSTKATIQWQYPDVADLKGFKLFKNDVAVASEQELKRDIRDYTAMKLEPGVTYTFTVRAVSESGVWSELSTGVAVTMQAAATK